MAHKTMQKRISSRIQAKETENKITRYLSHSRISSPVNNIATESNDAKVSSDKSHEHINGCIKNDSKSAGEFFPIRRSNRKPKTYILKERQSEIEERILSAKVEGVKVKDFENKGSGIVTNSPLSNGEMVVEYNGDLEDMKDAIRISSPVNDIAAESNDAKVPSDKSHKHINGCIKNEPRSVAEFFPPIRRSNRTPKTYILKEREREIEERNLSSKDEDIKVKDFENKGSGIVTNSPLSNGEMVVEYNGELEDMKDANRISSSLNNIATESKNAKASSDKSRKHINGCVRNEPRSVAEFFPIRRSNRKPKTHILKERQLEIEEKILSAKEEGIKVKDFDNKGRGIVTTRHFSKGEMVVEYIGDLIDMKEAKIREEKYAQDNSKGCYMYYFTYQNTQYCVDATEESPYMGRLVNHSRNGNLITKTIEVSGRPHLILTAKRDLETDTELLYDYGDRSKQALQDHPWLAL